MKTPWWCYPCDFSPQNPWPGTVVQSIVQSTTNSSTIPNWGWSLIYNITPLSYLKTRPGIDSSFIVTVYWICNSVKGPHLNSVPEDQRPPPYFLHQILLIHLLIQIIYPPSHHWYHGCGPIFHLYSSSAIASDLGANTYPSTKSGTIPNINTK